VRAGSEVSSPVSEHWQVVKVTGVGIGELWFDGVTTEVSEERAKELARRERRWIAVPIPYEPTDEEKEEIYTQPGVTADDYERGVVVE